MKTESRYLNFEELPNGDLKISLTKEGKSELKEVYKKVWNKGIWYDLLEDTSCNGSFAMVEPEEVGALTDAPIIVNYKDIDDDGKFVEYEDTKYWWFSDYMVFNEFEELLKEGFIIFNKGD